MKGFPFKIMKRGVYDWKVRVSVMEDWRGHTCGETKRREGVDPTPPEKRERSLLGNRRRQGTSGRSSPTRNRKKGGAR